MLSQLIKADFHGAIIRVYRAKCPGNVGITGIVAKDTENTFNIITIDNQLKVIPKQGHEFVFTAKGKSVILFGNQFRHRPADRINKKMNANGSLEL